MITTEELIARSQQGDDSARSLLVEQNTGLIWSVARRFIGRGTEVDDLFQLGCLGFLKAIDGFDPAYGTRFSTYAVPKISGEIRRFLRDDGAVKVSRSLKERAFSIKVAKNYLLQESGREPTVEELAEYLSITSEDIAIAECATATVESIQQDTGGDGFTLERILSDSDSEEIILERIALRNAIDHLQEREAMVIHLRYFHGLTQQRVSKVLQVSQVQVSRIEKKALQHLREFMG